MDETTETLELCYCQVCECEHEGRPCPTPASPLSAHQRLLLSEPAAMAEKAKLRAAIQGLVQIEASACLRSEAVGETGMRERFTAARAALRDTDPKSGA